MAGYEAAQRAPLQLKDSTGALGAGKRRKKKKKAKDKAQILEQVVSSKNQQQEEEEKRGLDRQTPAQAAFEKAQERRQMEQILKKASKTHKQRVEESNRHLDTLPEHHNIPKVSWTE